MYNISVEGVTLPHRHSSSFDRWVALTIAAPIYHQRARDGTYLRSTRLTFATVLHLESSFALQSGKHVDNG